MAARARCRFAGGLRESQPCPGGHIGRPYVHASGFVAGMVYIRLGRKNLEERCSSRFFAYSGA